MSGAALLLSDLLPFIAALVAGGAITGFLAGLLGVGGGAILVPVLYEVFRQGGVDEIVRMHMTLGTSLAVIVPTSLVSARSHWRKGAIDTTIIRRLWPWVAAGVVLGVIIAGRSGSEALKWIWVVAGSLMAVRMAFGRDDWRLGQRLPQNIGLEATAFAIGMLSALLSIGGGMFVVSLLSLYAVPIHTAVATSSAFGPIISIPGAIGYAIAGLDVPGRPPLSVGYVNLLAAAIVMPSSMVAAPWGVHVAHTMSRRRLEIAFAVFLALVALRFLWSLIP